MLPIIGTSAKMMSAPNNVPQIFDVNARRLRRQRRSGHGFFAETMAADLLDRLDTVQRTFSYALVIGDQPLLNAGLNSRGMRHDVYVGDEDKLNDRDAAYDLILSSGTLDTVADLPGALILIRRSLEPDGLLLANCAAAPSLTTLRSAIAPTPNAAMTSRVFTRKSMFGPPETCSCAPDLRCLSPMSIRSTSAIRASTGCLRI
jgi:SAM-dependent methyltransferase